MEAAIQGATTLTGLLRALDELPVGVNDLYDCAMKRIEGQSTERASIARHVLLWLKHAEDKLSGEDIQYALALASGNKAPGPDDLVPIPVIVAACAGLVEIRPNQYMQSPYLFWRKQFDELGFIRECVSRYAYQTSLRLSIFKTTRQRNTPRKSNPSVWLRFHKPSSREHALQR